MPVDIVYGETRNPAAASELAAVLRPLSNEGTVYLGYPVLASADEPVEVTALFVSPDFGLVAFQVADAGAPHDLDRYVADQDRLYSVLDSSLRRHPQLRDGRRLAFDLQTITVFPKGVTLAVNQDADGVYVPLDQVPAAVSDLPPVSSGLFHALQAAVQRVMTIKPAKRRSNVQRSGSRGAVLKKLELEIANLDQWQKAAAIESPDGPQRIRGLAGSGKTVVLALKAAYLQAKHEDWDIAVTFYSRALYEQIVDLVTRFSFEHTGNAPDLERLRVVHAWGSSSRDGLYALMAKAAGVEPRNWAYASNTYGMDEAFTGICRELLAVVQDQQPNPIFDAVLIDEAQDLPVEFFRLVRAFTREPKRIVWAYDELQKLSEAAMPSTEDLFGVTATGDSVLNIANVVGQARRDVVLPVCYRNTPWALATAHAVGFGVYSKGGLLQHFDEPGLWQEIGYRVESGTLEPGHDVTLSRRPDSYPPYFDDLLVKGDAVAVEVFDDEPAQDAWVAEQISVNLGTDELEDRDILIVLPDAYTSKKRYLRLARVLTRHGIDSHLVGVNASADQVFRAESVAVAHIYRAKGNEAPMVYVLDSERALERFNPLTRRNTLFTAITRSRAWVRICASGPAAPDIAEELRNVQDQDYRLTFQVPTAPELARLRRVNRERSRAETQSVVRVEQRAASLVEALEGQEVSLDDLDPQLRMRLADLLRQAGNEEELDR